MKKFFLIFVLISCVFQANASEESVGLDLYKKVDAWVYELNKKLLEKEMDWSTLEINNFCTSSECKAYFDWKDFTTTELDRIVNDSDLTPITNHLMSENWEKNNITTD